MADFGGYCILLDLHVFQLIIAQIKQTSNYLNHVYLLYTYFPDAIHLSCSN